MFKLIFKPTTYTTVDEMTLDEMSIDEMTFCQPVHHDERHIDKMKSFNGTLLKNINNYFNTNIYSHLETSVGQSSNLYLNVVCFFNTSVN
jgi:hypothetical protein